jgi:hypothetical protein
VKRQKKEEKEYEEEELDEKVFCYAEFQKELSKENDTPVQLTCTFQNNVLKEISPRSEFVLINEGMYFADEFYHWNYFQRLNKQFQKRPPKNVE